MRWKVGLEVAPCLPGTGGRGEAPMPLPLHYIRDWKRTQLPELCWFTSVEYAALPRMFIRRVSTVVISITNIGHRDTSGGVVTLELRRITGAIVASVISCCFVRAIAAIIVSVTYKLRGYTTTWRNKTKGLAFSVRFTW